MVLCVLFGLNSTLNARQVEKAELAPGLREKAAYITEIKIKTFHKVHKKVTKRTKKYHKKMKRAKTEKAKMKLAAKAQKDIVKIIEKSPLTLYEYNYILKMLLGKS